MIRPPSAQRLGFLLGALVFASLAVAAVTLDDLQRDIDAGHFGEAVRDSQIYMDDHPGDADARFLHARALAGLGNSKAAIAAFKRLAEDFPKRVEPANNLAVLYARLGEYDTAREWLNTALATQPAYAVAHRNLADIYTALAELAYQRALGKSKTRTAAPLTLIDRLHDAPQTMARDNSRAQTPRAHADNGENIIQTVRAWALAWSSQDFSAYADFYAKAFVPGDDLNRDQWRALRRKRLATPQDITIGIKNPSITHISAERVRVDFVQRYESPHYSDIVAKQLLLQRNAAEWRILRETSASYR